MAESGGRDDLDPDDLEVEIDLRSADEVASRLAVLAAVCRRAGLESGEIEGIEEPEEERFDLVAWLKAEGMDPALSAEERRLLGTPVGRLPEDATGEASWRAEALVALAWSAALIPAVPPYDEPADPQTALTLIPAPWDKTGAFRAALRLRSEEAIAAERERAELWHWRVRTAVAARDGAADDVAEWVAIVRDVAGDAARAGVLSESIGGDFPVRGLPFRELNDEDLAVIGEIAYQRHQALNWLCGFGDDWDEVPTET